MTNILTKLLKQLKYHFYCAPLSEYLTHVHCTITYNKKCQGGGKGHAVPFLFLLGFNSQ